MKSSHFLFSTLLFGLMTACVEEGHTPECGMGGRASFEEEKCVTPIGGTCLTRDEFEHSRPDPTDEEWVEYMASRTHCEFSAEDSETN